jgi:acyl-CoA synthetase (AMP-forming)/AMP-acid ligase II
VAEAADAGGPALPSALRELAVGGEQLRITPQLRRMLERMPGCALVNWYGPSETHVCTFFPLQGPPERWPALPPIGFPLSNSRFHVLDAALQPAPVGVYGELYIAGDCVARGYLHRPKQTAEKFVPDPRSPSPGGRMYRTGDWARWMPDGTLDFLGRRDHQVKIRGFRVELGEIEAALQHHPAVREAAVAPRADPSGAKRLVAYLTLRGGAAPPDPIPEIRSFLRERLPEYLVPSAFVVMEAFPLSPAGKVDRLSLPEPSAADLAAAGEYVAPRTPLEEALAALWSEVLQVARVGAHDAFWDLGGHSLLATQILTRMRDLFGVQVPIRTLFEAPTVAKLAEALLRTADAPRIQDVAQMLKEVSEMSDEQVEAELSRTEDA